MINPHANDNQGRADLADTIALAIHEATRRRHQTPGDAIVATAVALGSMIAEYAKKGSKDEVLRNVVALLLAAAEQP